MREEHLVTGWRFMNPCDFEDARTVNQSEGSGRLAVFEQLDEFGDGHVEKLMLEAGLALRV